MYGNLKYIMNEICNFKCDHYTKKLLTDLCNGCPIYNCLRDDIDTDNIEVIIPTKNDISLWKDEILKVKENILSSRYEDKLLPL